MGVRRRSCSGAPARTASGGRQDLDDLAGALPDVVAAERLAAALLADDPCRLRHVRAAAAVALIVSDTVPPGALDLLLTGTVLHDIGYAPAVRSTGLHPLDGALWLVARGAPAEVAGVVAHHSEAMLLRSAVGRSALLAAYPRPVGQVADVVTYADQTTAPDGRRTSPVARVADRRRRKPPADEAAWALERRRTERLLHAVARVQVRLDVVGGGDGYLAAVAGIVGSGLGPVDGDEVRRVAERLPGLGPAAGLDAVDRVRAAVAAARWLAVAGPVQHYVDPVDTAVRLLEEGTDLAGDATLGRAAHPAPA